MSVQSFANDAARVAKFSDISARFSLSSMGFFFIVAAWTIVWLGRSH